MLSAYARSKIVLTIATVFAIICFIVLVRAVQGDIGGLWAFLIGIGATTLFFVGLAAAVFVLFARDIGRIVRHDYGLCSGILPRGAGH